MNHPSSLTDTKGGQRLLWSEGCWTTSGPNSLLREDGIATQQPGTKLTIIAGPLRGRRCIHEADVLEPSTSSTVPGPAFRVRLVTEVGEPEETVVVGCHNVKVGW